MNNTNQPMSISLALLFFGIPMLLIVITQIIMLPFLDASGVSPLVNFFVNLIVGLIANCLQPKKPSLHIHDALPAAIH